ncbi:hypothetical protein [Sutterella wadsworthensis]|uniref:hypothetical protein n=1 Tax=Sutterella wadsworthensis TaxID=40545 RepID=UPI001D0852BC|nr:hypothetical protein [Sutterella wadsworthensis]MCB7457148.1 hypothetical protein [Sutterella wadsworthensis]
MAISSILKTVALTVFLTIMQHHKFLAALPLALAVSAAWAADDGYTPNSRRLAQNRVDTSQL